MLQNKLGPERLTQLGNSNLYYGCTTAVLRLPVSRVSYFINKAFCINLLNFRSLYFSGVYISVACISGVYVSGGCISEVYISGIIVIQKFSFRKFAFVFKEFTFHRSLYFRSLFSWLNISGVCISGVYIAVVCI